VCISVRNQIKEKRYLSEYQYAAVTGLLTLGSTVAALADEIVKFRAMYHDVAVQSQEVGDVQGHALLVARNEGVASFSDGSVGTTFFILHWTLLESASFSFVRAARRPAYHACLEGQHEFRECIGF